VECGKMKNPEKENFVKKANQKFPKMKKKLKSLSRNFVKWRKLEQNKPPSIRFT